MADAVVVCCRLVRSINSLKEYTYAYFDGINSWFILSRTRYCIFVFFVFSHSSLCKYRLIKSRNSSYIAVNAYRLNNCNYFQFCLLQIWITAVFRSSSVKNASKYNDILPQISVKDYNTNSGLNSSTQASKLRKEDSISLIIHSCIASINPSLAQKLISFISKKGLGIIFYAVL